MIINPKPIINRAIQTTKRKVGTSTDLFNLDISVGEKVFINDRNIEYELIRNARGQYLDIQSESASDNSPNYVSITGGSLGGDFSPIPIGTEIEFWVRLDEITTASVAPYTIRFGSSYRVGFMMSSGFIRFRPNWISVGGGVSSLANNGSGLVRVTTASAHGRNNGDTIYLTSVTGGATITNQYYEVTVINSTTLDLQGSAFTGSPTGGTINQHIKFIVYDENGIIQDAEDLDTDVWYRVVLTTQNSTITLDSTGLHIGPYYRATRIHVRDFRITTPNDTIYWDFSTGLLTSIEYETTKTLVANPSAFAGKVQFVDDELLGNDLDFIEQESPYLLYRIKPQAGFVTPENLGAIKQYNTANINDSIDATEVIQACIDSPYNVLIDGYYYVKDTLKVSLPKTIELIGGSDGTEITGRDETLGCLYQGSIPTDMFHIFAGAVHINGGLLDFRNCKYDTANAHLSDYYVPPAAIRYCFWANLIQNGSIKTTMIGEETETRKYNCGHIGVIFDNSRVYSGDPQVYSNGYSEMHYVDFDIESRFIYGIIDARLGEPYQDYTDIIGHSSMGGFKVTSAISDSGKYIINTMTPGPDVSNVINNGSGLFRITTASAHGRSTGNSVKIENVGGTTGANGVWTITVINTTTYDLQGSTFAGTYTSGGKTAINSSSYTVGNNAWRILTFKWGTSSHFTIKVTSSGGSLVDKINQAIINAGYSTDTSITNDTTPAFKAETYLPGSGSNQAFTIRSNMSTFKLTCCRPCIPTVFNYNLRDIGCKIGGIWETADSSNIDIFVQTALVLSKAGTTIDGVEPSEWDYPKVTLAGSNNNFNIYSIDLEKGNSTSEVYKSNIKAWKDIGESNKPIGASINSLSLNQVISNRTPENIEGIIRNHRYLSHTRYGLSSGKDGFIGHLDNALMLADQRFTVEATVYSNASGLFDFDTVDYAVGRSGISPDIVIAEVDNLGNLFDTNTPFCQITYDSTFNEELDFVEILIDDFTNGVELMSLYLELYTVNRPRKAQVILKGATSALKEVDLINNSKNWFEFDGFNQNNTSGVALRLVGVKDKDEIVQIAQFAGKSKLGKHEIDPFVSIAGNTRVWGPVSFDELKIKDGSETFHTISPQPRSGIVDLNDLLDVLETGGYLY